MLKAKNGRVYYGCVDITDEPILNWTSADGKLLKPSKFEIMKGKTWIMREDDGDRYYYIPIYKWEEVWYCSNEREAQKILDEYEQRDYDMEEACMDMEWEYEF